MKNIIKIEGIEYIKLSKFKELEKTKVKEVEKIDLKDYYILHPANVSGFIPIKKDQEEIKEIDIPTGLFKKISNPKITLDYPALNEGEVLTINGTRISKELVEEIKKMASVWFSDTPEIFMMYDKKKKEFIKDCPVIFLFDNKMCFIIAPRVESEE